MEQSRLKHNEANKKYRGSTGKDLRNKRIELHQCVHCGALVEQKSDGSYYRLCKMHHELDLERSRVMSVARNGRVVRKDRLVKKVGECYYDFCNNTTEVKLNGSYYLYCEKHRVQRNMLSSHLRDLKKELGQCVQCSLDNGNKSLEHSFLCEEHWFRSITGAYFKSSNVWEELRVKAVKQDYKCAYSGYVLIPGVNMSLDHIVARSVDSSLKDDIANVQWVDIKINKMKQDVGYDEFIIICKDIVAYSL